MPFSIALIGTKAGDGDAVRDQSTRPLRVEPHRREGCSDKLSAKVCCMLELERRGGWKSTGTEGGGAWHGRVRAALPLPYATMTGTT